jgi:fructose-1,6-bisphosphatase/inositol monophosphatase family enzyme
LEGNPVVGIIVNMKEKKMYVSANGKNSLVDLETNEEKEIKPSERTSIKDKGFCLATYLGEPKYALSFFKNFSEVEEALMEADNDAVNQPHTGSFIYGPMAEGNVDAYLIAREPISEQLPGWAFAQVAGFTAWEINPKDGSYKEIKHDLNSFKENPSEYRKGRMPVYLVTRSDQVRDEIIALIVKGHKKQEFQKIKDLFISTRTEEFEIFRASRKSQDSSGN